MLFNSWFQNEPLIFILTFKKNNYEPSSLILKLVLWIFKTFSFDDFHKLKKIGLIYDKV
jgi:hypothetical protein